MPSFERFELKLFFGAYRGVNPLTTEFVATGFMPGFIR